MGSNGRVGDHNHGFTSGETVVIGRKGSIGAIAYSPESCWPIDTTYYVDQDGTAQDLRWLYWQLQQLGLGSMNKSAAVPGLNREDAYRCRIPLPPLPEQRRIASILDAAAQTKESVQAGLALLTRLSDSIVFEALSVSNGRSLSIAEVATIQGGLTVNGARSRYAQTARYLRVANVYRGRLDLAEVKELGATDGEIARVALEEGDLLFVEGHGNRAEVGRVARWPGSETVVVHQNHLIRARPNRFIVEPRFLEAYVNSSVGRRYFRSVAKTTSGLNTINVSDVRQMPILLPELEVQRATTRQLNLIEERERYFRTHLSKLDELFASLQHRAFRGEL